MRLKLKLATVAKEYLFCPNMEFNLVSILPSNMIIGEYINSMNILAILIWQYYNIYISRIIYCI